ncbi:hypothetical protein PAMP_011189 [Pampus punctatissimus]
MRTTPQKFEKFSLRKGLTVRGLRRDCSCAPMDQATSLPLSQSSTISPLTPGQTRGVKASLSLSAPA